MKRARSFWSRVVVLIIISLLFTQAAFAEILQNLTSKRLTVRLNSGRAVLIAPQRSVTVPSAEVLNNQQIQKLQQSRQLAVLPENNSKSK